MYDTVYADVYTYFNWFEVEVMIILKALSQ